MVVAMGGNLETLIKKPKPHPATDGLGARQARMGTTECGKAKCDPGRGGRAWSRHCWQCPSPGKVTHRGHVYLGITVTQWPWNLPVLLSWEPCVQSSPYWDWTVISRWRCLIDRWRCQTRAWAEDRFRVLCTGHLTGSYAVLWAFTYSFFFMFYFLF